MDTVEYEAWLDEHGDDVLDLEAMRLIDEHYEAERLRRWCIAKYDEHADASLEVIEGR